MKRLVFLVLVVAAVACKAKIGGSVTVDGADFKISTCRNGQALGFFGVELDASSGQRLRLVANADGTTNADLFAANAVKADTLGTCGTLVIKTQNSTINNVRNIEGTADLACSTDAHKVSGKLTFANCH